MWNGDESRTVRWMNLGHKRSGCAVDFEDSIGCGRDVEARGVVEAGEAEARVAAGLGPVAAPEWVPYFSYVPTLECAAACLREEEDLFVLVTCGNEWKVLIDSEENGS
ncbi:neuroligin-3 [Striga asiatica]|uniref:Neuroligin-3 n=1 Tax=Striga asiatica TaxID=4170 RepID=A0A5A7QRR9_STRAF|nr:neuroligin-3 [Striga asiatica]